MCNQSIIEEEFFKKARPLNGDAHQNICLAIKVLCASMIASKIFAFGFICSHLYTYITTVNSQPDVVLIVAFIVFGMFILKLATYSFGYYLASNPE